MDKANYGEDGGRPMPKAEGNLTSFPVTKGASPNEFCPNCGCKTGGCCPSEHCGNPCGKH